jgi:hypothetical protein
MSAGRIRSQRRLHVVASGRAVDLRQFGNTPCQKVGSQDVYGQCGYADYDPGQTVERGGKGADDAGLVNVNKKSGPR